jgi:hypothetical protein
MLTLCGRNRAYGCNRSVLVQSVRIGTIAGRRRNRARGTGERGVPAGCARHLPHGSFGYACFSRG